MSRYAWANPTNGLREQDDNLSRAIGRVQEELRDPKGAWAVGVIVYSQEPAFRVESATAYKLVAPSRWTRFWNWLVLKFSRKERETEVRDE
jgi:hypothetical protein